ncbi:hypothetical protein [Cellulomonas chitinilytica]|nr:hypothetical protein [Cellulomonas chitinilytica]
MTPEVQIVQQGLTVEEYAHEKGVTTRSVRRWLAAGELPDAWPDGRSYRIPRHAERVQTPGTGLVVTGQHSDAVEELPRALAGAPTAWVDLETASRLLGVTPHAIVAHPDLFEPAKVGPRGSWRVPMRVIRRDAGL